MKGHKGKHGSKKYGRNKIKCERYQQENRRIKNKIIKIKRYLRKNPNDRQAERFLQSIS